MEFKDLITEEPAMDNVVEMQSINKERTEQEIINDLKELARVEGELVTDGTVQGFIEQYRVTSNVAADYCINEGVKEVSTSVQEDATTGVRNTAVGDAHLQEAMYPEPEIERITGATVQSSAAKVSFTCGVWTAAVTDKRATQQVEHANNKSNVGKFKKELLVGFQPVKDLNYLGGLGRNTHYGLTHPFGKSGDYIVPTIDLPEYVKEISGIVQRFDAAKESITKSSYDDAIIDEQLRLGPLYNADDYPTFEDLKDKYHMSFSVDPIPESFVTNLEASQAKEINDYYQQQHAERMDKFSNAVFAESLKHIKKLRDSLNYSGESKKSNPNYKVFKESTYEHVEDTIRVLERFNFGGDARMQAAHKILRDAFVGKSVEMLKHSEGLREEAKKSLDDAIAALPSLDI